MPLLQMRAEVDESMRLMRDQLSTMAQSFTAAAARTQDTSAHSSNSDSNSGEQGAAVKVWQQAAEDAKADAQRARDELASLQAIVEQLQLEKKEQGRVLAKLTPQAERCEQAEQLVEEYQKREMEARVAARNSERRAHASKEAADTYRQEMEAYKAEQRRLEGELNTTREQLHTTMQDTQLAKKKVGCTQAGSGVGHLSFFPLLFRAAHCLLFHPVCADCCLVWHTHTHTHTHSLSLSLSHSFVALLLCFLVSLFLFFFVSFFLCVC